MKIQTKGEFIDLLAMERVPQKSDRQASIVCITKHSLSVLAHCVQIVDWGWLMIYIPIGLVVLILLLAYVL